MKKLFCAFVSLCSVVTVLAQSLTSPDGKYVITVDGMTYSVTYSNQVIIEPSRMGVDIDNRLFESALGVPRGVHDNWCSDLVLESVDSLTRHDSTWTPLYGENSHIRDHYNQMVLHYQKGSDGQGTVSEGYDKRKYYAMDIIVRAYNEGIAFRYHFPETANSLFLHITGEQTQFAMPAGTQAWYEEWAQGPYTVKSLKIKDNSWFESERPLLLQLPSVETRDFTMPEVCQYARSKGIGVWVYVNQRALYQQLDELLPLYREWGISGIKFGFVHIGNQQWSTWLHDAIEKCAKYHIMVDIHDEYRPTGLSRTYPNLLTQEGIRGNEEMPDADHNTLLPFTRYLCGPADYTLCYFNSRVKNTKCHQLAMAAVYYSPLQFYFWYDNPFVDKGEAELQFWRDCPTTFDESIALDGIPGEYIIQARRSGDEWFVGCMTNTQGRTVTIPTDFLNESSVSKGAERLPKGKYQVTCYNDNPALSTRTNVQSAVFTIQSGKKPITLTLQPSGGAVLHFKPASR